MISAIIATVLCFFNTCYDLSSMLAQTPANTFTHPLPYVSTLSRPLCLHATTASLSILSLHGTNATCIACFEGMNKLLQRLPDSSREEVRNQAIVLIQQLTSANEEMKKTVVFNEVN